MKSHNMRGEDGAWGCFSRGDKTLVVVSLNVVHHLIGPHRTHTCLSSSEPQF